MAQLTSAVAPSARAGNGRIVGPAARLARQLLRLGGAAGGLAGLGLDLPGHQGGGPVHPAVRDGRGEVPDGGRGALPGHVAHRPPSRAAAQAAAQAAAPGPAGRGASSRLAQWGGMAVVGTLLLAFGNGGVSYAERTLPSGLAALLVASVPLWMALADRVINGQRISLRGWLALVIGLAGIAVLARPSGNGAVLPVLVVLGASVSWGIGSVLASRDAGGASPLVGSAMEMLTGGIVLTVLAAATGELTRIDPPASARSRCSGRST